MDYSRHSKSVVVLLEIVTKIDAYVFFTAKDNFYNEDTRAKEWLRYL